MRFILLIVSVCLFSGCATTQPIDKELSREQVYQKISPGDELIIELKSQEKLKIIVTTVTPEQIEANGQIYPFDDIVEIQKQGISILKTTGAVIGAGYLFGMVGVLLALSDL